MIAIAICVIYGSNVSLHIAAALLFVFNVRHLFHLQSLNVFLTLRRGRRHRSRSGGKR